MDKRVGGTEMLEKEIKMISDELNQKIKKCAEKSISDSETYKQALEMVNGIKAKHSDPQMHMIAEKVLKEIKSIALCQQVSEKTSVRSEKKELLQAIGSSKEQFNEIKSYIAKTENVFIQVVAGKKSCSVTIVNHDGIQNYTVKIFGN